MNQDPLITYSSLIPGGLQYMPGGLNLPRERQKQMRNESSQPGCSPGADRTMHFAKIVHRFSVSLRKSLTGFASLSGCR
jgi:hypothetical protein